MQTIATIGYGGMYPVTRYAHIVVLIEAMTGILGIALITGLTFTRFARPSARVLFSNKVTITPRDGVPHLMFRMANWRRNRIVEAQLRVVILVTERTREGEVLRRAGRRAAGARSNGGLLPDLDGDAQDRRRQPVPRAGRDREAGARRTPACS